MNDQEKIKQLETLIESILETLEYAKGSLYNPHTNDAIEDYTKEMRNIIDS